MDNVVAHPWKWVWRAVAAVVVISVAVVVLGLAGGWFSGTANLVSFGHSEEETTAVLSDWTQMQAAACNWADAKDTKSGPDDPTLVEDPAFAYAATYRNIKADYDRRVNNLFEAYLTRKLPIPGALGNLPNPAPALNAEAKDEVRNNVC